MTAALTKNDLSFLIPAMEQRFANSAPQALLALNAQDDPPGSTDKVPSGAMSIPEPVKVDQQGTMSVDDYKACSFVMAVCQNMVQKNLTDAAQVAGIDPAVALKDMNAWVQAYVNFPFPFFNFVDTQSDVYHNEQFSLNANPDIVESVVNIKNVPGLSEAVIGALQKSGGQLGSYEKTDRLFNYFGVITAYNETEISVRVIKFAMNLKTTVVKTLCGRTEKTNLDTAYDTYQFVADKEMMIKMQSKIGDQTASYFAGKLEAFIEEFFDDQLVKYKARLASLLSAVNKP